MLNRQRGTFPRALRVLAGAIAPVLRGGCRTTAGGQSPPASARPAPGQGVGLRCAGCDGHVWGVPQGRGKRGAFPCPRPERGRKMVPCISTFPPAPMAKAIAFAMSQRRLPPRPWAGRWPALCLWERSCATVVSYRAANRSAFAGPPRWATLFAVSGGCSRPGGGRTKIQQCDPRSALIGLFHFRRRISDDVSHRPPPMACTSP